MTSVLKKVVLGLTAASTLAVTATPADAQRYYRHYHHGDRTGLAIGAGILGLGLGAAIASSNRGYYRDPYYGGGYYGDPYGYGYGYRGCVVRRHWDPYWGRWVRVRVC
ncbi:MAG TPA: hypothetical protein VH331_06855 [Allosphingosinicella sp.]|jgi:hypothetical protein|nr:hypothetical protein [Allosphingosinicella sp.]